MPRSRSILSIAIAGTLLSATVAFSACGGGGSSKKTPTAAPVTTSTSGGSDTTPASGQTDAPKTPSSGKTSVATKASGGSGGDSSELKDIAEKFANSTFSADYNVTGSLGADITDASMKLAKKGKDRFRFEITGKQAGQDLDVIFIDSPDGSAFCLKNAGGFGALLGIVDGEGVCIKSNADGSNPASGLSNSFKDLENLNSTVLEKSKRTIAGRSASCYKVQANDTQEISTACFDSDGTLLYVESAGADAGTIEATSVSKDVGNDDFSLPYPVKEIPGFGGDSTATP